MANFLQILKSADLSNTSAVVVSDDDTKLIQKRILEVLDDVKSVCDEFNIDYQLGGGSLLGAVRHKGFIPWDDDIDINMCRKSFNEFLPHFKEKYGHKYWIHVLGESKNYDLMMAHIVIKDVRAREILDAERVECGLCVDIFVMENTYNNPILRKIHGIGCMGLRYALSCVRFKRNKKELLELGKNNPELQKYISKRLKLGNVFSILPLSFWAKTAAWWVQICHNDESKFVVIPSGQYQYFKEMYRRKTYCALTDMSFENRVVKGSKDYDGYLKNLYGDYMQIPPVEKRQKHIMMELDREALKKSVK
jgi:lipopolysaccharide cholinephosphotransferase